MSAQTSETAIALALGSSVWESEFVAALVAMVSGAKIRRCVDVVDLAGYIDKSRPDLVVIDDRFPRLDVSTISRISQTQTTIVGVCADKSGALRLKNLGIDHVVPVDAGGIDDAAAAVVQLRPASGPPAGLEDSAPLIHPPGADGAMSRGDRAEYELPGRRRPTRPGPSGRITAVWGPPGGVGRTHIALTLAQQLADSGRSVLLADADMTCAGIGPAFCLTQESSGLIAAAHHAERGTLDPEILARLARAISDNLRVLTGLSHIRRRAELRAAPMSRLWVVAGQLAADVVVDIGGCLDDGSLVLDGDIGDFGVAAGGQSAPVTALGSADHLVAVCSSEPAAVARLISHVGAIASLAPSAQLHIVVNRIRCPIVASKAAQMELTEFIRGQTGATSVHLVAEDRSGMDAAVAAGLTLFEANSKSPAVAEVVPLARALSHVSEPVAVGA